MDASIRPVTPPMTNKPIQPIAYSIGVSSRISPLWMVAAQLYTLIAEGTATMKLIKENVRPEYSLMPL